MSDRNCEIPISVRKIIIDLWKEKKSFRKIGKIIGKPHATVQYIINQYKSTGCYKVRPRSGRPRKLTAREESTVVKKIRINSKISAPKVAQEIKEEFSKNVNPQTIRNCLHRAGYNGRVARRKPLISEKNRKKRLEFAREHANKTNAFWETVIFSDETKINLFGSDGRDKVWRKKNTALKIENVCPTVKHGGGNVLLWGCMSANGVGNLAFIDGIMDQHVYLNILRNNLNPSVQKLELDGRYLFQQDNDPKHTARLVREWMIHNVRQQLHTPPQSPDINPIEHLWEELKRRVRKHQVRNKEELKNRIREEWENIPPEVTRKLVLSLPKRLEAIMRANGNCTKY